MLRLLPLALLACAGPPAGTADAPNTFSVDAGVQAPPGEPLMLATSDPAPGGRLEFMVANADPGETVYYALSPNGLGAGPCPAALGGLCVGLDAPLNVFSGRADGAGQLIVSVPLPGFFRAGDIIGIQAFAIRGPGGRDTVGSPASQVTVGGGGAGCEDMVIDFEGGFWPIDDWELVAEGGEVTFEGYWGDFSLVDVGWTYLPTSITTEPGTVITGTIKPGDRTYIGFDSDEFGTKSFVLSALTDDIRFQDNPGYTFTELDTEPYDLSPASWYEFQIEILDANRVQGRLYTGAGEPLALLEQDYSAMGGLSGGGLALRGFGGSYIDQVRIDCP
ncbi:MAG: hypothetical protein ACI8PZ_006223 [Myxococcota bacterium]